MKKYSNFLVTIFSILSLVSTIGISSCGDNQSSNNLGTETNPVKIGVVGIEQTQWDILKKDLATSGTYIKLVNFTDYNSENPATSRGELDINQFQHLDYLAGYNNDNSASLVPLGATAIFPIGLYPNKDLGIKSLNDIKAGDQIIVPNDETNGGRALNLLQTLGFIKLNNKQGVLPTIADVDKSSKVKVTGVDPAETAHGLTDPKVVAAVVNNDYVKDSNINYSDALAREKADDSFAKRYINIWVTSEANKANPLIVNIVDFASKDQEFLKAVVENSGGEGSAILQNKKTAEELQQILLDLEKEKKNLK